MGNKTIQVFEHQTLYYGREYKGVPFTKKHFDALAKLNELHNNKYFTLLHKGIKFSQYVGVVQIDTLIIEILPKADKSNAKEEEKGIWRDVLIEMLRVTRKLKVNQVGQANVNKQNIHLLDIYFEWFLREVELLQHRGLIKKYYKQTKNVTALKGKLEFAGHISKNLIHKERFYTTHQIYDKDHKLHQIINLALEVIEQVSKGTHIYAKCKSVQLDFPEVSDIKCNAATFEKLKLNRKTQAYETAIEIARLIILNYAPNISSGSERMLALLFDMNSLWEEYVLVRLKKAARNREGVEVYGQRSKRFWRGIIIRPDIVIEKENETIIIDTKWKDVKSINPSTGDLRQMYVYNDYWAARKALMLYPATKTTFEGFTSFETTNPGYIHHQCGIGQLSVLSESQQSLNLNIGDEVLDWLG